MDVVHQNVEEFNLYFEELISTVFIVDINFLYVNLQTEKF